MVMKFSVHQSFARLYWSLLPGWQLILACTGFVCRSTKHLDYILVNIWYLGEIFTLLWLRRRILKKAPIVTKRYQLLHYDSGSFSWNIIEKWWSRKIQYNPPPPWEVVHRLKILIIDHKIGVGSYKILKDPSRGGIYIYRYLHEKCWRMVLRMSFVKTNYCLCKCHT